MGKKKKKQKKQPIVMGKSKKNQRKQARKPVEASKDG